MYGSGCRLLTLAFLALATVCTQAQADRAFNSTLASPVRQPIGVSPIPGPATPETMAFRQLVRAAGTIFSGTVTNIEPRPATGGQSLGTVAITFHVQNAIRGAVPGQDITISEWIGLWSSGQRYRVGERVALFLYPASRLGLTSSVGGRMGRFEVDAARRILISGQHRGLFRGDPLLGGKVRATFAELALAVRNAGEDRRPAGGSRER